MCTEISDKIEFGYVVFWRDWVSDLLSWLAGSSFLPFLFCEKNFLDMRSNASLRNQGSSAELGELIIICYGKRDVLWNDSLLVSFFGGTDREFDDLMSNVFHDSGHDYSSISTDSGGNSVSFQKSANSWHWEDKTSPNSLGYWTLFGFLLTSFRFWGVTWFSDFLGTGCSWHIFKKGLYQIWVRWVWFK